MMPMTELSYLRILPPVLVACGVCLLGFSMAGMGASRVRALLSLRDGAVLLSAFVNRHGLLLNEALRAAAAECGGCAAECFTDAASHLEDGVAEAFEAALSGYGDLRSLKAGDRRAFMVFAARMTKGREECAEAFNTLCSELDALYQAAVTTQARDGRMYRSLGILAALACGILMI